MFGPEDEFGGYEEYEASPYNGDDQDGYEFDTFGPEEVAEDEPDSDEILDDVEEELAEELDAPGGEDAFLDAEWEDRLSGLTGFELGE